MHELSITHNIIAICSEEAEKHKAKKVTEIRLKIGELSGMVPECIQNYFDILSAGTKVEGAVLKVEKVPLKILCRACGFQGVLDSMFEKCPDCGSEDIKLFGGNEFYIDSLEVEDGD